MRLLEIIRTLQRTSGGPAESLRINVAGYKRLGHSVEVLTLDPPGSGPFDFDIPVHMLGNAAHGYGYSSEARRWLRKNAHRFDGVVVHGLWQSPGLLALQELAGRYPYAVFTHGMLDPWFKRTYPLKHLKKLPYWFGLERWVLSKARAVLFTTETEARLARRSFPLSRWIPRVVPFGTPGPGEVLEKSHDTAAFRNQAGLLESEPYLLYAGRIHEKKGCDLLIEAYINVSREYDLARLVMAGPDPNGLVKRLQITAIRAGIGDRILWSGMLEGGVKWAAFREAEVFALPSHQENFGIAVAEALSVGVPVLISDQVNIHIEVSSLEAGYVAEDTLQGTEALLRQWAETPREARERMRVNARQCWLKHFNSEEMATVLARLWQQR